jgi:hypothetical protein
MWVSSALTTLTFLGVALNHFETIAFSRIVERQRARVRELEDQRQAARTIEPLAYQHQIQKLVARIRAGDRAPDDTYTCPRCGNRTLKVHFSLHGARMSINVLCRGCGRPSILHISSLRKFAPAWLLEDPGRQNSGG